MPRSKKRVAPVKVVAAPASQTNNILYLILAIVVVFCGYMFVKMQSLEKQLAAIGTSGTAAQADSPISVDNLKKMAKTLNLDTSKFNKCLDNGDKKSAVAAQEAYGASLGVQGTPGFFINGRFLAGAFPFQFFKEIIDKELAGTGSANCGDYSADLQKYCSDPQNKAFDPVPKQIDVSDTPVTGSANAKITIVEFSDFQCPFCIRAYPTVEQVLSQYKGQVKLYYKQFPLTQIHPFAQKAAEASLCAVDQGKFWEFYNKVFTVEQSGN